MPLDLFDLSGKVAMVTGSARGLGEVAYSGVAPVSEAVVDQFQDLTGLYIYNVYGMTETNSPSNLVPWGKEAPVDQESGALKVQEERRNHEAQKRC